MFERNIEHLFDLSHLRYRVEWFFYKRNDRRHVKPGNGFMGRHEAQNLDIAGSEADFLVCFPQCGGGDVSVARILLAARKSDLTRMMLQGGRSFRQKETRLLSLGQNRHENPGRAQLAPFRQNRVRVQVVI